MKILYSIGSLSIIAFVMFGYYYSAQDVNGLDNSGITSANAQSEQKNSNRKVKSFRSAKKKLESKVYYDHRTTFYCGCGFDKKKKIDPRKCGYTVRKSTTRGGRVEWEHVVPAWRFGHNLKCWKNPRAICGKKGGRKCCRKKNIAFELMEADMNNLVPSDGKLNADRSNFPYGEIPGEERKYGQCDFEVDFKRRIVEPAESIRGDIARIYLYMNDQFKSFYGKALLGSKERKRYLKWSEFDPVTAWECKRNRRIKAIQGNGNLYVEMGCFLE